MAKKGKQKQQPLQIRLMDCNEDEPAKLMGLEINAETGKRYLKYNTFKSIERKASEKIKKVLYIGYKTDEELQGFIGKNIPLRVARKNLGYRRTEPAACIILGEFDRVFS